MVRSQEGGQTQEEGRGRRVPGSGEEGRGGGVPGSGSVLRKWLGA